MAQPITRVQNPRDRAMRIGIDALAWNLRNGYGRYCRELVLALLEVPRRYSLTLLMNDDTCAPPGVEVIRFGVARSSVDSSRGLSELMRLSWTIARAPVDAWFFPSPLNFVPVISRTPSLVAVHDTIPWRYPNLIFDSRLQHLAWRIKLGLAMRQAARIITVSNQARDSIAQYFGIASDTISIVGEAPASVFKPDADSKAVAALSERIGLAPDARVIVYHGAIAPHKNLRRLVNVFAKLCRDADCADLYLVLAGSGGDEHLRSTCQNNPRIKFPGSLDDSDLALLLNRATLAVLPSLDEGFGLTGVEAVACGAPLIATRSSALPDVLGDGAVYFDPTDEDGLYSQMVILLADGDRRRMLRERGLEQIAKLGWKAEAMRLVELFDEVLCASRD